MPEGFLFGDWCRACNAYTQHMAAKLRNGQMVGICQVKH